MNGAFAGLVVANRQVTVTSQRAEALMNTASGTPVLASTMPLCTVTEVRACVRRPACGPRANMPRTALTRALDGSARRDAAWHPQPRRPNQLGLYPRDVPRRAHVRALRERARLTLSTRTSRAHVHALHTRAPGPCALRCEAARGRADTRRSTGCSSTASCSRPTPRPTPRSRQAKLLFLSSLLEESGRHT